MAMIAFCVDAVYILKSHCGARKARWCRGYDVAADQRPAKILFSLVIQKI